jgi:N-acetylmuramoyl-L-alanine amidase
MLEVFAMSHYLWILDNGHGKSTAGKRSPALDDGTRLFEYLFNRAIVKKLSEKLNAANIKFHVLVPEVDGDIARSERVIRANQLPSDIPKLYISIHGNAFGNGSQFNSAHGIETFHYPSSLKGRRIASVFQEELIENLKWKDRGIKTAEFTVLKNTNMPAVLTENGFYTNLEQCKNMLSSNYQSKIAEAHFQAIKRIESGGVI